MSITTLYGRLSEQEYRAIRDSREGLEQFEDGSLPDDRVLFLDRAAPVLAWLLSARHRAQQAEFATVVRLGDKAPGLDPAAKSPPDDLQTAVTGANAKTDPALDAGMGPAFVLSVDTVSRYAAILENVDEGQLRKHLDFAEMDAAALPVDGWEDEGEELFSDYIFPLFQKLQAFYREAADEKQMVIIWNG